jgi:UDP-N-acetylmuramate dehydrogenase
MSFEYENYNIELAFTELRPLFGEHIWVDEPLARHNTFGVGGKADIWIRLEAQQELITLVERCATLRWPLLFVGNGTNILYSDTGVQGIVARIAFDHYTIEDHGDGTALLTADAGVSWPKLINALVPKGWAGLEFGPGIPGTLGGGVVSNAGAHGGDIGQVLEWVDALDVQRSEDQNEPDFPQEPPVIRRYKRDELDLGYRQSRFRAGRRVEFDTGGYLVPAARAMIEPEEIVLQLGIRLHHEDPQKLRALVDQYKQHRKQTQPPQKSAGSIFKNPPGDFAGRLIEEAGLKGKRHGKAQISPRHANFIVNLGGASAADITALIIEAHNRVLDKFGVNLELEVELRGEWGILW